MNRNDIGRLAWIDFLLSAISSCLAVYTLGEGLRIPVMASVVIGLIIGGTLFSVIMHRLVPLRRRWIGALLYFLVAIFAIVFMDPLMTMMPDEGFPRFLLLAGGLAWMMAFGSFFQWQESTLIFQAVPGIALFGLVGAFDTFAGAPFAFFGFLLCFATLFARANSRTMMRQAQDAGFGVSETPATLLNNLRNGPWRYMAGPAWALGSALVVVLFSILGAPLVQASMQSVAGSVRLMNRNATQINASVTSTLSMGGQTVVGAGPRQTLRHQPVMRIKNGPLDYYRMETYGEYTGRGWRDIQNYRNSGELVTDLRDQHSLLQRSLAFDPASRTYQTYDVDIVENVNSVPIVGIPSQNQLPEGATFRSDGTLQWRPSRREAQKVGVWVKAKGETPTKVGRGLPPLYYGIGSSLTIPQRVREFARTAVRGGATDYERAQRLKTAIGQRIYYDLKAPAVPAGRDPVDYVIFDSKRGYCDLFATSMVVMARSLGMPARYATGYYPSLDEMDGDTVVLNESEAHAWAEIFFDGVGWVSFDPTEDAQGSADRGEPTYVEEFWDQPWVEVTTTVIAILAIGVGGFFGLRYLRRGPVVSDPRRLPAAVAYLHLIKVLERGTGRPKRPSQAPSEYISMITDQLGAEAVRIREISGRLAAGLYAAAPLEDSEVQSLRRQIAELKSRLRK
jgi:transglutaminase-like putative cysteine protease